MFQYYHISSLLVEPIFLLTDIMYQKIIFFIKAKLFEIVRYLVVACGKYLYQCSACGL